MRYAYFITGKQVLLLPARILSEYGYYLNSIYT